jgi:very-short-patch-repair endonuclease
VDLFAPAVRLVIEVDGAHHSEVTQTKYDKKRSTYLEQIGLKVLRFDDRQVLTETDAVIEEVFQNLAERSY